MQLISESRMNYIRGKASVEKASAAELHEVFDHIARLEASLDDLDEEDYFGTEGWRRFFGHPDAD